MIAIGVLNMHTRSHGHQRSSTFKLCQYCRHLTMLPFR